MNFSSIKELQDFCDQYCKYLDKPGSTLCSGCELERICEKISNDDLYIETSPEHFQKVLNYLRKEKLEKLLR